MTHSLPHRTRPARHFHVRPTTQLGVKSVLLVGTGVLVTLFFSTLIAVSAHGTSSSLAPYFALTGLLVTLVGGPMGLLAIIRHGERSVAAMATTPFFALALVVFMGELLQLLAWLL